MLYLPVPSKVKRPCLSWSAHIEIDIRNYHFVFRCLGLCKNLPFGIDDTATTNLELLGIMSTCLSISVGM
jgi:hypothetical protein